MPEDLRLTSLAHGGGCGCKLSPAVLRDILATSQVTSRVSPDVQITKLVLG